MTVDELRKALEGVDGSLICVTRGYESGFDVAHGATTTDLIDEGEGKRDYWRGRFQVPYTFQADEPTTKVFCVGHSADS